MDAVNRSLRQAKLRLFTADLLRLLGWSLLFAVAIASVMVLVDKLTALVLPWWSLLIPAGVAVIVAAVLAMRRWPSDAQAAVVLDENLKLKDVIATSLSLRTAERSEMVDYVHDDAQKRATGAAVGAAVPVRLTKIWAWLPVAAAVLVLLAWLMPHHDLFKPEDADANPANRTLTSAEAKAAHEQIVQAKAQVNEIQPPDDLEAAESLQELKEQLASLSEEDLKNPDVRREAAAKLSDIQDRITEEANAKQEEVEAVKAAMSQVDPGESGPADEFANAMRRGDFKAAEKAMGDLQDKLNSGEMSESDREALGEQMGNMADQLRELQKQAEAEGKSIQQKMEEQLKNQGMTQEQIDEIKDAAQSGDQKRMQEAIQKALEQQGQSPEQAKQNAEKATQQMKQMQQQLDQAQSTGECSGSVANQMQQMQQQAQNGQSGQDGQSGQQGQNQPGEGQQALQQLSQQGEQAQQMKQAGEQAGNAAQQCQGGGQPGQQGEQGQGQQLAQGQGQGKQGQGQQQNPGQSASSGKNSQPNQGWGSGDGGNPYGQERDPWTYQKEAVDSVRSGEGRVIASWVEQGQGQGGDAETGYDVQVKEARDAAERAVTDDRVPRRYHKGIRDYFRLIPDQQGEAAEQTAPRRPGS